MIRSRLRLIRTPPVETSCELVPQSIYCARLRYRHSRTSPDYTEWIDCRMGRGRGSVPLVRQHGQRVKLDSFLMQLLGLVRRGLAVDRAVLDLAVVHLARLFGKSPPNIIGVSDEMLAQFLQLAAELALLRRHYGDRRGNIRLRRFRRRLRCQRLRRCRSLGHRRGDGRIAAPFRSRHSRRHDCLLDLSRIADRTADEPALDLTVVRRRVREPALECVPLVARQRVADHSEPRIAWRGCAIGPIISNPWPCWSKRIFARAAVTSARSISDLPPFLAKA